MCLKLAWVILECVDFTRDYLNALSFNWDHCVVSSSSSAQTVTRPLYFDHVPTFYDKYTTYKQQTTTIRVDNTFSADLLTFHTKQNRNTKKLCSSFRLHKQKVSDFNSQNKNRQGLGKWSNFFSLKQSRHFSVSKGNKRTKGFSSLHKWKCYSTTRFIHCPSRGPTSTPSPSSDGSLFKWIQSYRDQLAK